ncbi:MAG: non-ribosomal peptide synthetase [Acidobacteriota bacterium]|nr:non-ribosomal peptide synthetase [Acidobacteriota bacterium]
MTATMPRAAADKMAEAFSRLTPSQAHSLKEWNDTRSDYPRDAIIPALFEQEVRRSPGAIALVSSAQGDTLTYDALNRRANQLAHHLRELGVRSEMRVAIYLDRSLEMIVAMLAVLKAGGAYVPIDPALPLKRAAFVLEDSGSSVVLSREALADALPSGWARLVCLDSDAAAIVRQSEEDPPYSVSATGLAHLLYTSGSTGEPKGVAVVHRGVVRLVRGTGYARFGPDEVFLQAAPASFDASTFEIWGALLNGGRLVVLSPPTPGLDDLAEAIRRHGVTTLWLTAGLFHLAVDERLPDLKPLRQLLAGGDVLSPERVRRVLQEVPGCALINGYGPTETTTFAACHAIRDLSSEASTVPIGRPIANTQIYLLDSDRRWVPPGEAGEVYIGGDGLTRGYWNRPELSAAAFVDDPFDATPGARLYRTGDLARLAPDGNLEFLGRVDQQIKVQGFRVEPSEIEAALERHPAVSRNVVEARETAAGGRQLVAYVVLDPEGACGDGELRGFLQRELPEYMVPAAFVRLSALPLTANGKVDRRALPEPARGAAGAVSPPLSMMEEQIAQVWRSVLDLDGIDCDANFFDLGGNSLLLMEAHAILQRRLAIALPITALFEYPTVRSLARSLDGAPDPNVSLRALRERVRERPRTLDRGPEGERAS